MLTHVPGYNVTTDSIRSKTVKDSYVKWDAGLLVNAVTTTNSSLTLDNSHDSFYINNANAATISVTILDTINDYTENGNNSLRRVNVIIDSRSAATDRTVTFTIPNTFTLIGGLSATRNLYHGNLQVFVVEIVNNTVNIYDGVGSYFEEDSNGDLMPLESNAGLVPRTDLSGQLGTGDKRWAKVYAGNITNTYDSVADMVSDTSLKEGGTAFTKGYYNPNDGGAGVYTIRTKTQSDVEDGGSIIFLDNENVAELITDGTVNVTQFGAKNDGTEDASAEFTKTMNFANSKHVIPFVPVGTYLLDSSVSGYFASFGEVTITGSGTVTIIDLQNVAEDAQDSADNALSYRDAAQTSAAAAAASASDADATATALTNFLETKETLTAPAVDHTITISGAAADAKIVGAYTNSFCDGLGSINVPVLPFGHIYPKKYYHDGNLVDNAKYFSVYDIPVKRSWKISISDYTTYKYGIYQHTGSSWYNTPSGNLTEDYVFSTDVSRVYIRITRVDNADLTQTDVDYLMGGGFKITDTNNNNFAEQIWKLEAYTKYANYPNGAFIFQKVLNSNDVLSDNTKNILLYSISVSAGSTIGMLNYSTYKIAYKSFNGSIWGSISSWTTNDIVFTSAELISVYIQRIDGTDVTSIDFANAKSLAFYRDEGNLDERISVLENGSTIDFGTDFINNYVPSSLLSLPTEYATFPIAINISRDGNSYGHNLRPDMFVKNNSDGATYYVSPNGDDTNNGLSPSAPLKSINTAVAKTDVNTIILLGGTYYNGTHFTSTPIAKEINIIGVGKVVLRTEGTSYPLTIQAGCYIENIIFDGGYSACTTELTTELCVFNKCAFLNSGSSNGLTAKGGYYILFDCVADNNMMDGFNYHGNSTYVPQTIEICCKGRLNGDRSALTQNNGSTNHETGSRIIRIGCVYSSSRGGVVADADRAISLNIAVTASSTEAYNTSNRNGNFVAINEAKMWLYDCASFGSPYDIIADESIINTTKTYARESAVNSGSIVRIS